MTEAARRFAILALDGGGARGYLSAKILEYVESYLDTTTGKTLPLGSRFDLIAGTSTGGIIALGLAAGNTAREIAVLYETHVPIIFGPTMRRNRLWAHFRPRYRSDALRRAVNDFFGDRVLADVQTDVCVTAVSLLNAQPRVFRSGYVLSSANRMDERFAEVAMATSAAPTYFEAQSVKHFNHLADGGLCANNPTLVALVEAMRFSRASRRGVKPPTDIAGCMQQGLTVLSVGAGEQCAMPYDLDNLLCAGTLTWGTHFHNVAIESQSQLVHQLTKSLIGHSYRRINPRLDFPMEMDDAGRAAALKNLAELSEEDEAFLREYLAA